MTKQEQDFRHEDLEGYDSSFEDDEEEVKKKGSKDSDIRLGNRSTAAPHNQGLPSKSFFQDEQRRAESYRNNYFALNAYERHKKLINDYVLYYPGSRSALLKRDSSKDKNDRDIIEDNHRFLWDDSEDANTWEKQLAKKYYDKLFKEYGLCDLSRYTENKIAIRWRTESEVVEGKGQFICGEKKCPTKETLRTWEVNFAYMEEGVKKNALVKLRLCTPCSIKLNFRQQKKEVTKKPKKRVSADSDHHSDKKRSKTRTKTKSDHKLEVDKEKVADTAVNPENEAGSSSSSNIWKETVIMPELKSREEEFDEYLDDLFL